MSRSPLQLLSARIERRVGILPPAWMVRARVEAQAAAMGMDPAQYLERLLAQEEDGPELEQLIEMLRIGETRFFRHPTQIDQLREVLLPAALQRAEAAQRPVRLWSAGCGTGEEAWTLAMLLSELIAHRSPRPPRPELLGTDLSAEALQQAEAGRYPAAAARHVPSALAHKYLEPVADGLVAVRASLRQAVQVRFRRHNLLAAHYPGPFDLILCRNVLIYFDAPRRRAVLERLRGSLHQGGSLLLAPGEGEEEVPAGPKTEAAAGTQVQEALVLRGSYGDGQRLQQELRPYLQAGRELTLDLDGVDFLGEEDARVLRRAAELVPLRLRSSRAAVQRWLQRQGLASREPGP
ncbi:MAG: CheR family methyltransferase [Myxococcales bacterium]|nr:CheR family methyltransferase [Myxococcales bacterium]